VKYKLADLRINYDFEGLYEKKIEKDPFKLFDKWFKESVDKKVFEPNGMTLATVDANGKPSARIVLLKDISKGGFVFFTHYTSRKGKELQKNNNAAAVFWWNILARQVRIEGSVEKLTDQESDSYFNSRPRGSRLGALASNQSNTIPDYTYLVEKFNQAAAKYQDSNIPRPENWGGYRLIPERIEFWQGRENRLHDRLLFTKGKSGDWKIERLAP
jgi:pyridoxamine 5'-phosphate oxidase